MLPAELESIERASVDELRSVQLERLRWSLQHAYDNVPHYRKAFDTAGVHPADCRDLADLANFPFTAKEDLREQYPFGMFAVPREQIARLHASSGTTGKPTVVGYTREDIRTWAKLVARSIRASGGRPGDRVHVAYGYGLFTGGLGAHYGAEELGCTVIPVSGGMTERQVNLIRDFEPDIIMVTPSYMLAIVDEMVHQGSDPAPHPCEWGSSARSHGPTTCDGNWSSSWTSTLLTSTDYPRSSDPESPTNAWKPRMGHTSGKIIFTPR